MSRELELAKYRHVYAALPNYRMGDARKRDAIADIDLAFKRGCRSILDIGCGRGEMLDYARRLGFEHVEGTEVVPELCTEDVHQLAIHELKTLPPGSFDLVTCFDVIEHVLPPDDSQLLAEMGRLGRKMLVVTANNRPSVDPTTGNDLHVNIKTYQRWDEFIRNIWQSTLFEPHWCVEQCRDKRYVSETWRAWR